MGNGEKLKMVLIGFIGSMRSGKTLMMVIELLKKHQEGKELYTNFHLNYVDYNRLEANDLDIAIRSDTTLDFENAVFGIDEIHVWLDSRSSSSKRNKITSYFMNQSGKLNTYVFWTSQFLRQVDIRIRLNTQIVYKCVRYIIKDGYKVPLSQDDKRVDFLIDAEKYELKDSMHGLVFVRTATITIKKPSQYFPYYDTKQRISYKEQVDDKKIKKMLNEND